MAAWTILLVSNRDLSVGLVGAEISAGFLAQI